MAVVVRLKYKLVIFYDVETGPYTTEILFKAQHLTQYIWFYCIILLIIIIITNNYLQLINI